MPDPATRPAALLIDLDDTIVDYTGSQPESWRLACERASEALTHLDRSLAHVTVLEASRTYWSDPERQRIGRRDLRAASAEIFREAMRSIGVHVSPTFAREIADYFRDLREEGLCVFPEAVETLAQLRYEGFGLALVTNGTSAEQRGKIARFELESYFDHVQIEGEFGAGKPEAEVYAAALEALDVSPAEAWFIGDHIEFDVLAPMRAGMRGAWVSAGRELPAGTPGRPDIILERFSELPSHLREPSQALRVASE